MFLKITSNYTSAKLSRKKTAAWKQYIGKLSVAAIIQEKKNEIPSVLETTKCHN